MADKVNSVKTPLGGEAVYTKEGVLFIRSQNVNNNKLELENSVFIPELINNQMKNSIVQANDILLNITGASLGRSCVIPNDFKSGNVNQHVCIIRLNKQYLFSLNPSEQSLISFFLPEGILEYFQLTKVEKEQKELQIYLKEKNTVPSYFSPANQHPLE